MAKKPATFTLAIEGLRLAMTPKVTRAGYASCTIFSTQPAVCPLCQAQIPPNTLHECSRKG